MAERSKAEKLIKEIETDTQSKKVIYTIGHSNHSIEQFISLLKQHGITAVADVRSVPYSRFHPQFNKDALASSLKEAGIAYVFLGKELGARPEDPACYENGKVDFNRVEARQEFKHGLERIIKSMEKYRVALMCAEKEPLDCHRTILVSRNLKRLGVGIKHILPNGTIEDHRDAETRLLRLTNSERGSFFDQNVSDSKRLERAYNERASEIAYRPKKKKAHHEQS